MPKNHLKIEHREIGNTYYGYATKIYVQGGICKERHSVRYILCPYTIYEHFGSILGEIYVDNLHVLEQISEHKTGVTKR